METEKYNGLSYFNDVINKRKLQHLMSQTYHNYCLDCTACDSNLYAIYKFRHFIDINITNQKFIFFKSNLNKYSFTLKYLIRGPPVLS